MEASCLPLLHPLQTSFPHRRQWCLGLVRVNIFPHSSIVHRSEALSGIQTGRVAVSMLNPPPLPLVASVPGACGPWCDAGLCESMTTSSYAGGSDSNGAEAMPGCSASSSSCCMRWFTASGCVALKVLRHRGQSAVSPPAHSCTVIRH